MQRLTLRASVCVAIAVAGVPAAADLLSGDSYVTGRLCVGANCVNGEGFGEATLKLKQNITRLTFEDTSSTANYPANNWQLWVNDDAEFGLDRFTIRDRTGDTMPFTVQGGAPDNALWIADTGFVGLGTSMPGTDLHIVDGGNATIRLETDTSQGGSARIWDISAGYFDLHIFNRSRLFTPFVIDKDATSYLLKLGAGKVGINTESPVARLHVRMNSTDIYPDNGLGLFVSDAIAGTPTAMTHLLSRRGQARLRVEETDSTINPRTLLELANNGRPEIVMANTATDGEWSFGAGTDFFLKTGTVGSASSTKTKVFTVKQNGDAIVFGTLTTGGTFCGGGCDRVFDAGFNLPSIAEHAEAMFALGHLPNVGPTVENEPINVSDKLGRMLNELEHAHIYIAELETSVRRIPGLEAENRALADRLARLEALVADAAD